MNPWARRAAGAIVCVACSLAVSAELSRPSVTVVPAATASAPESFCLVVPMNDKGGGVLEPAGAPGPGTLLGPAPAVLVTSEGLMSPAGRIARYALVMIAGAFGAAPQAAFVYEPILSSREHDLIALRFKGFAPGWAKTDKPKGIAAAKLTNLSKGMELSVVPVGPSAIAAPVACKLAASLSDPTSIARVECLAAWPGGGGVAIDGTGRALGLVAAKTPKGEKGFQFELRSIEGSTAIAERVRNETALVPIDSSASVAAKVTALQFATEIKADGTPKATNTIFDPAVMREVFAVIAFSGFEKGMQVREIWTYQGKAVSDRIYPWAGNRSGTAYFRWDNGGKPFGAGPYTFQLYVAGTLVSKGGFSVSPMSVVAGLPVRVVGKVIDADTRLGIDGVTIGVLQAGLAMADWNNDDSKIATIVISDYDGSFEFPDKLPRGNGYSVFVTAFGYQPIYADYALKIPSDQGDPMVITITMKKAR